MSGEMARQLAKADPAGQEYLDFFNRVFDSAPVKPFAIHLWNGTEWNHSNEPPHFTLSQFQAEFATNQILAAGLTDRCRVELCDYREVPADQQFDKLVSVGMFEHVGEANLQAYFKKAYQLLKPDRVFLNHGITESATNLSNTGRSFIDKYIFPDGELRPISTTLRVAEETGFEVRDVENLREHYAMTLRLWGRRLEANRKKAIEVTCPETYRVWRIYMAGSAYSFETGRIGLCQSLLTKSGHRGNNLPLTRCDWYFPGPNGAH